MKRSRTLAWLLLSLSLCPMIASCQSTDAPASDPYGTLVVADIEDLTPGSTAEIQATFSLPDRTEPITYTCDSDAISIENGIVTALTPNTTVTVTAATAHHTATFTVQVAPDRGTVTIPMVYAWVDYPASDFIPVFSRPEYAEPLTYTCDKEGITIDSAAGTVTVTEAGMYTVIAKSAHFETEFKVKGEKINRKQIGDNGSMKFSAATFNSAATSRLSTWKTRGNEGKTVLFVGDSFFDTQFWSNFYTDSYPDMDALCLGISATTTYDWEDWIRSGWLSKTAPKAIVMHMGTNNVYDDGDSVGTAVSSLQRMFTMMHNTFPEVPIYWFAITQRGYDSAKIAKVDDINALMKEWCDARDYITYLDATKKLSVNRLRDSIHPKVEYYTVFAEALEEAGLIIEEK